MKAKNPATKPIRKRTRKHLPTHLEPDVVYIFRQGTAIRLEGMKRVTITQTEITVSAN